MNTRVLIVLVCIAICLANVLIVLTRKALNSVNVILGFRY